METTLLFAPLISALLAGFTWRLVGEVAAQWIAFAFAALAALLAWVLFLGFDGETAQITLLRFVESGSLSADWAIRFDRLTAMMWLLATTLSALVHLYAIGYFVADEAIRDGDRARLSAYMSFATFAALVLACADDLIALVAGWQLVGFATYLLIGFYFRKPSATQGAEKALILNRIGDGAFVLGVAALIWATDAVALDDVFVASSSFFAPVAFLGFDLTVAELVSVLFVVAVAARSAQLVLHVWQPDGVAAPSPASALINVVMLGAGVFLLCRMSPVLSFAPNATSFAAVLGGATAVVAASAAMVQIDIKRVLAYLTSAQFGIMLAAIGVGQYSAALFHLLTFACVMGLLSLAAGSIIRAMGHKRKFRDYGGFRAKMPLTFGAMLVGALAFSGLHLPTGVVGFSGAVSLSALLERVAAESAGAVLWMLVASAVLSSLAIWRLTFRVFFGKFRTDTDPDKEARESPLAMTAPLVLLAIGAICIGMIGATPFVGDAAAVDRFFGAEMPDASSPGWALGAGALFPSPGTAPVSSPFGAVPLAAMLIGLIVAWWCYVQSPMAPKRLAESQSGLRSFLLEGWYIDALYARVVTDPLTALARGASERAEAGVFAGGLSALSLGLAPATERLLKRPRGALILGGLVLVVLALLGVAAWAALTGGAG